MQQEQRQDSTTTCCLAECFVADSRFLGYAFVFPDDDGGDKGKRDGDQNEESLLRAVGDDIRRDLKRLHPDAAHVPVAVVQVRSGSSSSPRYYEEDGEPPGSAGPAIADELEAAVAKNWKNGVDSSSKIAVVAVAIVRYFGRRLLGVTCGRLSQCYRSTARLTLYRYFASRTNEESGAAGETPSPVSPLPPFVQDFAARGRPTENAYGLGAGDCELVLNVVAEDDEEENSDNRRSLVNKIRDELNFDGFRGAKGEVLPRLQNLQADLSDNLTPVYRYPGNYSGDQWTTFEWSPTSLKIKKAVEDALRPLYPQTMNHCVTNYYRDGDDFIAHHSDKDLDLNRDGVIISVSLGDERVLELRRRTEPHDATRIVLPHRSMLVLGPHTNQLFSHSILPKPDSNEARVSLTFRDVKTYKDLATGRLFGQGVDTYQSLRQVRIRYMIENAIFFSGFCAASSYAAKAAASSSKRSANRGGGAASSDATATIVLVGLFTVGSLSFRMLANEYYRRREERAARDFFSKKSMSGTTY